MKPIAAPIPHHALAQAYAAANHQHSIPLSMPMSHAQAGAPLAAAPLAHPQGHLWSGPSVYHTPALGLSHHLPTGQLPLSHHLPTGQLPLSHSQPKNVR